MKILIFLMVSLNLLLAEVYYARVEPFEKYTFKASASGEVTYSNLDLEGKFSKNELIVKVDDKLDKIDLENTKAKLAILNKNLQVLNEEIENLQEMVKIKKSNYEKTKKLKTKSKVEKDRDLFDLLTSQNALLQTKEKVLSIKTQIEELDYKREALKDTIAKKSIYAKELYIYKVNVKDGDYVSFGTALFEAHDISKAKLTFFISKEDLADTKKKEIYLDEKLTEFKIDKIYRVADSEFISAYRAEIYIPAPKLFSKLIKIELKPKALPKE